MGCFLFFCSCLESHGVLPLGGWSTAVSEIFWLPPTAAGLFLLSKLAGGMALWWFGGRSLHVLEEEKPRCEIGIG